LFLDPALASEFRVSCSVFSVAANSHDHSNGSRRIIGCRTAAKLGRQRLRPPNSSDDVRQTSIGRQSADTSESLETDAQRLNSLLSERLPPTLPAEAHDAIRLLGATHFFGVKIFFVSVFFLSRTVGERNSKQLLPHDRALDFAARPSILIVPLSDFMPLI